MKHLSAWRHHFLGQLGVGWLAVCALTALLVLLPVAVLVSYALDGSGELWTHLMQYVLPQAFKDSLVLLLGVGCIVITIGTGTAWLVTAYEFPGSRFFNWALLLPLAIPSYIIAYAYLDLWHPVGTLQEGIRYLLGYSSPRDLRLPDIRSMWGCILLLGLVLYPYVYLPTRAAFHMQAAGLVEASRTLGAGPWRIFFSIALPLARPAIAIGGSLALMETLNDIGASEFLGIRTLTVSIYTTWTNRSSLAGASQIALFMLAIVFALIVIERWARRRQNYAASVRQSQRLTKQRLRGVKAFTASLFTFMPILFGFILPTGYLLIEAIKRIRFAGIDAAIWQEALNTIQVSVIATVLATVLAFILTCSLRQTSRSQWFPRTLIRIASIGYAVPGTVLALGLLAPIGWLDNKIDTVAQHFWGISTGLLFSGTTAMLVYAYVARFLAIGNGGIESGLSKIPKSIDDAAYSLGHNANTVASKIHLPLCWPAIAAAMLLTFVDCMKELPATLLLRPMNFETLATHLYGEAARGTYESAAIAALFIILIGLLPIMVLSRSGFSKKTGFKSTPR